jgi:hypothetical protein
MTPLPPQRGKAVELDTRVKVRTHPGRRHFSTSVAAPECGLAPSWDEAFPLECLSGTRSHAAYVPCVSFRCVMRSMTQRPGVPTIRSQCHDVYPLGCVSCPCSVVHVNLARSDDLLGMALVLLPLPTLRSSGSAALPLRLPLSHGGGTLTVSLSLATSADSAAVEAAIAHTQGRYTNTRRFRSLLRFTRMVVRLRTLSA